MEAPLVEAGDDDEEVLRCAVDDDCDGFYRCIDRMCAVPPAMTGGAGEQTPSVAFRNAAGEEVARFSVELALTRREQQQGLMHRPHMRDDWGMLFVYDRDGMRSFWMQNTLIPLDMIFINDASEVVGVVERAEPQTLDPRTVGKPARYILEINGGLAEQHSIERGVIMSLENVDDRLQPRQ